MRACVHAPNQEEFYYRAPSQRREIEDVLSKLRNRNGSIPNELEKFLELAGSAYSLYKTDDLEKQRRLLKSVTSNLAMQSKNVEFTLASPFAEIADHKKAADGSPSKGTVRTTRGLLLKLVEVLSSSSSAVAGALDQEISLL